MTIPRSLSLLAIVLAGLCLRGAIAQGETDAPRQTFNYVLGKTKLPDAVAYWRASGAKILGAGHLALGTGSGVDGLSKTSADKVTLVDVTGIDFEGIASARFGFYDKERYVIQARLVPGLLDSKSNVNYDKEQLASLEKRLRQKYGPPKQQLRSLAAKGRDSPDVFIWNIDGQLAAVRVERIEHQSEPHERKDGSGSSRIPQGGLQDGQYQGPHHLLVAGQDRRR